MVFDNKQSHMSRKITQQAVNAFMTNGSYNSSNTKVSPANNDNYLYLHGSIIAIRNFETNIIQITNGGWFSNTTKERLNGIPDVSIQQKQGVWYLNGNVWDGKLIRIK